MITEEGILKTQAIFNDDKTHRYLLKKTWDESLPSAAILMTNASSSDVLRMDFTTMYAISNSSNLGYGSISIVNIFSFMTTKLDLKSADINSLKSDENEKQIIQAAKDNDIFVVATGSLPALNKKVGVYQDELFKKLYDFKDKIKTIRASDGSENNHVLSPKIRFSWTLVPFKLPVNEVVQAEAESSTPVPEEHKRQRTRKVTKK